MRALPVLPLALVCSFGCGPHSTTSPQLVFDAALGNRFVHAAAPTEIVGRFRLGAPKLAHHARAPINVALVVDTSGSMEGKAMDDARTASLNMVTSLEPGDRVAVISFDSRPHVLVPSSEISSSSLKKIREQVAAMKAEGTTDMVGGLYAGLAEVTKHLDAHGVNRIVLMTDGVPNVEGPLLALAQQAGQEGVTITTFGLGVEYDETLMAAIAQKSGGRFHYIDDSAKVASVFADEVLRLKSVVAKNLVLTLNPGPGIEVLELVGQPGTSTGGMSVALGDLGDGDRRDVIVRLRVTGRRDGAAVEVLDGFLSYDDPENPGRKEDHVYLSAHATADESKVAEGEDRDVQKTAAHLELAGATLNAIAAARQGQLPAAGSILDAAEKTARDEAKRLEDPTLDVEAKELEGVRESLPSIVQQQLEQQKEQERAARATPATASAPAPAATPGAGAAELEMPSVQAEDMVRARHDEALDKLQTRH